MPQPPSSVQGSAMTWDSSHPDIEHLLQNFTPQTHPEATASGTFPTRPSLILKPVGADSSYGHQVAAAACVPPCPVRPAPSHLPESLQTHFPVLNPDRIEIKTQEPLNFVAKMRPLGEEGVAAGRVEPFFFGVFLFSIWKGK